MTGRRAMPTSLVVEPSEDRVRLDRFLASRLPEMSRAALQRLAREGGVLVEGAPARPARPVRSGERVSIVIPEARPSRLEPEPIPLPVLHEDEDLLVLDKPAGLVVHPGSGVRGGTLVHALLARGERWSTIGGEERPGIVHRLDRGTSGVMVVARNDAAHRALAAQFKDRLVEKEYLALVWGRVERDRFEVDAALGRDLRNRRRISPRTAKGREAVTRFEVVERYEGFTLVRARPRTGRTHQIRAHLREAGHPIVGDAEYGGGGARAIPPGPLRDLLERFQRLALHARSLRFVHPRSGESLAFEAPIPREISDLVSLLRAESPRRREAKDR